MFRTFLQAFVRPQVIQFYHVEGKGTEHEKMTAPIKYHEDAPEKRSYENLLGLGANVQAELPAHVWTEECMNTGWIQFNRPLIPKQEKGRAAPPPPICRRVCSLRLLGGWSLKSAQEWWAIALIDRGRSLIAAILGY